MTENVTAAAKLVFSQFLKTGSIEADVTSLCCHQSLVQLILAFWKNQQ